jgi:hypothetical protein
MADYELDRTALGQHRFEHFVATRGQRVEALRALLADAGLELGAGDAQLDALEHWYRANLAAGPDGEIADRWLSVASDIGTYLSEVLRERHPQLQWKLWSGRDGDIHAGRPVLVGFPVPNPRYNVDLIGATLTLGRAVLSGSAPRTPEGELRDWLAMREREARGEPMELDEIKLPE